MRILVDTNIIIDYIAEREPYFENSRKIIFKCSTKEIDGFIAAHSVGNTFYILRKEVTEKDRRNILINLCEIFTVSGIDKDKLINALNNNDFKDFEDWLQAECALSCGADYIVARNIKDFANSPIPAIVPEDFLKII